MWSLMSTGCPGFQVWRDAAGAVGEHHRARARRGGRAHAVDDPAHAVALVVVRAGADDEHALAARACRTLRSVPTWPSSAGALKPVTSVAGNVGGRLADELGGLAPAAAEGQGDVVALDAGDARRCRRLPRPRSRTGRRRGRREGCRSCLTCPHSRQRPAPGARRADRGVAGRRRPECARHGLENGAMSLSFERTQSVAIIGGGPGGYEAALAAAQLGAEVTLVERAGVGGSAVITDVVPSKTLIATADAAVAISGRRRPRRAALREGRGRQAAQARDRDQPRAPSTSACSSLARQQSDDMRAALVEAGVRIISGHGRLEGEDAVVVSTGPGRHRLRPHRGRHPRRLGRRVAARAAHREARRRAHPHLDAAVRHAGAARAPHRRRLGRHGRRVRLRLHEPRRARSRSSPAATRCSPARTRMPRPSSRSVFKRGGMTVLSKSPRRQGRAHRRRRARHPRRRPHGRGQPLPHGGRRRSPTPRASASRRPACR